MQGTFLPVDKLLKIDQYVFELVLGSDNFWEIYENYSCFEVSIKLLILLKGTKLFSRIIVINRTFVLHEAFKCEIFIVNCFFDTTSYPRWVPIVKYYSFMRNEIANNI